MSSDSKDLNSLAAPQESPHTCHDMNPPYPYPCAACERERAAAPQESPQPQDVGDLGLSFDMIDVDRLRQWALNFDTYGPDLTHWTSLGYLPQAMRAIAGKLDQAVREIGTLRRLAAAPQESQPPTWQPIETAPKDGSEVLLLTPEGVDVGHWKDAWGPSIDDPGHDAGWFGMRYAFPGCTHVRKESSYYTPSMAQPTHWMPIPPLAALAAGPSPKEKTADDDQSRVRRTEARSDVSNTRTPPTDALEATVWACVCCGQRMVESGIPCLRCHG